MSIGKAGKVDPVVTERSGFGILFKYQLMNILYYADDNCGKFIRFSLPDIYDVTDENRYQALLAADRVNDQVKVAKACIYGEDSVWVFYEHYYNASEDLQIYVPLALRTLLYARTIFHNQLNR